MLYKKFVKYSHKSFFVDIELTECYHKNNKLFMGVVFMFCTKCGTQINEGIRFCTSCGADLQSAYTQNNGYSTTHGNSYASQQSSAQAMNFDFNTNTASAVSSTRYEYKVLSQKDKWFSGKFDPMILEQAINSYAQQGWRVIGCATADIPGFGTARQEFITLLEREVK